MYDLNGRVAIVTGSGKGIGAGIALALASCGANVIVNFVNDHKSAENTVLKILDNTKAKALMFKADISIPSEAKRLVDRTVDIFGKIDILINNAGIATKARKIEFVDSEEIYRVMQTNFMGAFYVTKEAFPYMKKNNRGDIHFISSRCVQTLLPGLSLYAASKASLEALANVAAKEGLEYNIRANIIRCGLIETNMASGFLKRTRNMENIRDLDKEAPFGRTCKPEDVGNLCAFLCSENAGYISGATIDLHGGNIMLGY